MLDGFGPWRDSIIWSFNRLFWRRLGDWEAATAQLIGYIEAIAPDPAQRDGHVGVVTDGRQLRSRVADGW